MADIILRQANVIPSTGGTIKGTPLTNAEVDNNFANLNISTNILEANVASLEGDITVLDGNIGVLSNLTTTTNTNVVAAVNEVRTLIIDPIPFAIALG